MTKRVGAKQECGASTHIEETLLDLVRWHDSHGRYEALVRCVAVRPSADLHDDRPASIDLLASSPLMLGTTPDRIRHCSNAFHRYPTTTNGDDLLETRCCCRSSQPRPRGESEPPATFWLSEPIRDS